MLRALQVGLKISDLETMDYGMVMDIMTEAANDNEKYDVVATQDDFDRF